MAVKFPDENFQTSVFTPNSNEADSVFQVVSGDLVLWEGAAFPDALLKDGDWLFNPINPKRIVDINCPTETGLFFLRLGVSPES